MPNPPKPPEPKPAALRFSARDVKFILSSPAFVLFALVLATVPGLVPVLTQHPEVHAPERAGPTEEYAADTRAPLAALADMTLRGLPPPDEQRQLRAPCDPDLEHEFNGYCWVPIDVRPCPPGKTWEHQGKCYQRAMRVERKRVPTSGGEMRQAGVAGP